MTAHRISRVACLVAAAVLARVAPAPAQTCHETQLAPTAAAQSPWQLTGSLRLESASVKAGYFVGATPRMSARYRRLMAGAALPYYYLNRGKGHPGVGDLLLEASWLAVDRRATSLALTLAMGAPTGDATQSLGMGHWMAMPAAMVTWRPSAWEFMATVGLGRSLARGHDHRSHSGTSFPVVGPMNPWELNGAVRVSYKASERLRPEFGIATAFTLQADMGTHRGVGLLGASYTMGKVAWRAQAQAGLFGDPFYGRFVLDASWSMS